MPLRLFRRPSFKRSVKKLGHEQRKIVGTIVEVLYVYYASGCSFEDVRKIAPRFFHKQLRKPYYEAGVEGKTRVIIKIDGEKCLLVVAGNHNQIKQFLSNA